VINLIKEIRNKKQGLKYYYIYLYRYLYLELMYIGKVSTRDMRGENSHCFPITINESCVLLVAVYRRLLRFLVSLNTIIRPSKWTIEIYHVLRIMIIYIE